MDWFTLGNMAQLIKLLTLELTDGKKTIFVTGFGPDVNEQELLQAFITFGE